MPDASEFAAIERIRRLVGPGPPGEVGIGDDAAVVRVGGGVVVVAADALVAGVHADLSLTTLADLGWKALAVNVSDVAAMGCAASRAVVTITAPSTGDVDRLYPGLVEAAASFGCPIVGGDLTSGPVVVVSVTVLGDGDVVPPPVLRSGARPGDMLWVTGPLGGAAAGLRALSSPGVPASSVPASSVSAHARPVPRVAEGILARELGATAMIDVSDGFAADLGHLLDASGVGCSVASVPVAPGASPSEAMAGGDDYELVFTLPAGVDAVAAFTARGLRAPMLLGRCLVDVSEREVGGSPLDTSGWAHWE